MKRVLKKEEAANKKLGVLIYENVQPMDVIGPWEVFATWKTILNAPIDMFLVAETSNEVCCANQISLKPHCEFNNSPQFDYLLVPGGFGRLKQVNNPNLISFLKKQAQSSEYLLSVCTGAFLLHAAGLLTHHEATTYWRAIPELKSFDDVQLVGKRIVKSDKVWTTGGISSGIDMAFEFISTIAGNDVAGKVQLLFEYFPHNKLYCKPAMVSKLPSYYTGKKEEAVSEMNLPDYIKEYFKKS
ncbi:TPA: DJ-1/PfpI family protein [Legionella pneumophila]|uniref:DJ-1/PfpI family protein n=1 Tax=Legionella pneumophila TaxID=446 RepID=A0A2S6F2D3_LEGPN|nr:DJ-1/PfpI family protein [Legionella pneumophila]APF02878.1 thiamine biosynthesis protein ThiJ [Legionella pneumophila subsp. fraseri]APF05908.1 thiamine biosynthesis protein ThiJ [Legionella pneumophila subsp. fraseri]AUB68367.1 thiamine biosynthesis protein ThiJ [Legionella pneumophila]AUB71340.1 thiamine biosynthesis protein ThiJ [Legionella pneumophila]KXB24255.1 thiamine biosynthesis protein ThiJ [Legionella pneumophila]